MDFYMKYRDNCDSLESDPHVCNYYKRPSKLRSSACIAEKAAGLDETDAELSEDVSVSSDVDNHDMEYYIVCDACEMKEDIDKLKKLVDKVTNIANTYREALKSASPSYVDPFREEESRVGAAK